VVARAVLRRNKNNPVGPPALQTRVLRLVVMNRFVFSAGIASTLVLTVSCGRSTLCFNAAPHQRVVPVGVQFQLRAGLLDILHDCDLPAPAGLQWLSANPEIATVDTNGVLRGIRPGRTEAIARYGRKQVRTPIEVVPAIARLQLSPVDTTITIGDTVVFRAAAYAPDGSPLNSVRVHIGAGADNWPRLILSPVDRPQSAAGAGSGAVVLQARSEGTTHVFASVIGLSDSVLVRVRPRE